MVNHDTTFTRALPSICIPHTLKTTNGHLLKTFENILESNCIKKVDIINKKKNNGQCVFILMNDLRLNIPESIKKTTKWR